MKKAIVEAPVEFRCKMATYYVSEGALDEFNHLCEINALKKSQVIQNFMYRFNAYYRHRANAVHIPNVPIDTPAIQDQ